MEFSATQEHGVLGQVWWHMDALGFTNLEALETCPLGFYGGFFMDWW